MFSLHPHAYSSYLHAVHILRIHLSSIIYFHEFTQIFRLFIFLLFPWWLLIISLLPKFNETDWEKSGCHSNIKRMKDLTTGIWRCPALSKVSTEIIDLNLWLHKFLALWKFASYLENVLIKCMYLKICLRFVLGWKIRWKI